MAKKNKFYVVWEGRSTGVFSSWWDCKKQVDGYSAKYKGFPTKAEAEKAFLEGPEKYWGKGGKAKPKMSAEELKKYGKPELHSMSVDAAWNSVKKDMEYRGVYTDGGMELFRMGPYPDGTNNVGEFLALVHGLALMKQSKDFNFPIIYSDSRTAISWVKNKKAKTTLERTPKNGKLFELIERAEKWLKSNTYTTQIRKWETKAWGEIPADFGRK